MRDPLSTHKAPRVILASVVVILLAGSLAIRLLSRDGGVSLSARPAAPSAIVPEPRQCDLKDLPMPCWSCAESKEWPLRFRTDLDLLAPLGTGPANAATWFKDFVKPDGVRLAEFEAAKERRVEHPKLGLVLPADDGLLGEAEPWCDQAQMRFYPDFIPFEGVSTGIPNLVLPITLAKSWVARGMANTDDAAALSDFRRAIRIGRLLRQEDVAIVSDLAGLGCIRIGTEAIYDRARATGDTTLALLAAITASEIAPQKLLSSARMSTLDLTRYMHTAGPGELSLSAPDAAVKDLINCAKTCPDRRFRWETITALSIVRYWGTPEQQDLARENLDDLARSEDEIVAQIAQYCRDNRPPADFLISEYEIGK